MAGFRIVNLELGKPTVATAMKQMEVDLTTSRRMGYTVVKFIHGYGSSGTGGKIRTALRRELSGRQAAGAIKAVIPGEKFSIFEEGTRRAFAACPQLRQDRDLDRYNNGVTFVVL